MVGVERLELSSDDYKSPALTFVLHAHFYIRVYLEVLMKYLFVKTFHIVPRIFENIKRTEYYNKYGDYYCYVDSYHRYKCYNC